jgi:hypothetical protein
MAEQQRGWLFSAPTRVFGAVLHDGFMVATWSIDRPDSKVAAALEIRPAVRLPKRATAAVAAEGRRVMRFLEPDVHDLDVRFDPVP